jgi:hypothetical protein
MNRRKPTYFRNSLDLRRDKVQVKVLRKRLKCKLSDAQFSSPKAHPRNWTPTSVAVKSACQI